MREGGGVVDLPKADNPLFFADPTGLSFGQLAPGASAHADGDAHRRRRRRGRPGRQPSTCSRGPVPSPFPRASRCRARFTVTANAAKASQDETGFVVLTNGANTRRIPFWFATTAPKLASEPTTTLTRPGHLPRHDRTAARR